MIFPIRRRNFRYFGTPVYKKSPSKWGIVVACLLPFVVIGLVVLCGALR